VESCLALEWLLEGSHLEEMTGRYANANSAEHLVATNVDVPYIDVHFIGKPETTFNPVGVRGAGEIGVTGIPAAIANAIYNATGQINLSSRPIARKELRLMMSEFESVIDPVAATVPLRSWRVTLDAKATLHLLKEGQFYRCRSCFRCCVPNLRRRS
jgi:hypothetical protein